MPFLAPIAAAVVAGVTAAATAVSAVAADIALDIGVSEAIAQTVGVVAFDIAEAAIVGGALIGVSQLLKVGGGGMQVDFKADPQAGVPYVIGRTGTGGNIVFTDVAGSTNEWLTYVTVLGGGGPYKQIESFSAAGWIVSFASDGTGATSHGPVPGFAPVNADGTPASWPDFGGKMFQRSQLGTSGEAALTLSGGPVVPGEWNASCALSGKCATIWGLKYDTKLYAAGTPKPNWVVQGAAVYDPRLDSTFSGGSGPQRYADPSTWAYSENPYLHALTWCLGIEENGQRVLGVGAPAAGIDFNAFVEGANVADANGWKIGGVVYSTDNKWDVLTAMLQAGSGAPLKLGATISCIVNTPKVSLDTLTGDDVVGKASVTTTQSRRTRINSIWPKYREELVFWQMTPTQQIIAVTGYFSADGGPRVREVNYLLVQDSNQAAVLARYDIENSREFGPITLPCKPRWMGFRPGDVITVDEPEYGLNGQTVLILDRQVDPATLTVTLVCRSETAGKHAFALGETADPPSTPGVSGYNPGSVPTPQTGAWSAQGGVITGADGQTIPAIIVTGQVDTAYAQDVILDWRMQLNAGGAYGAWQTQSWPSTATTLIVTAVQPAATYDVQVRYRTQRGVEDQGTGVDLGTVTVGNVTAYDALQLGDRQAAAILAQIDQATSDIEAAAEAAIQEALGLVNLQSYLEPLSYLNDVPIGTVLTQEITNRTDGDTAIVQTLSLLGAKSGDGTAWILDVDTVMVSPTVSFAAQITALNTSIGDNTSAISTEQIARSDGDSALSANITSLTSTVNTNNDTLTASINSEEVTRANADSALSADYTSLSATVDGINSTVTANGAALVTLQGQVEGYYMLSINANGAIASMELIASSGTDTTLSAVVFDVDSFFVKSSSNPNVAPFYYDATTGTLFTDTITVRSANIQDASIETIHLSDASVTRHYAADTGPNRTLGTSAPGTADVSVSVDCTDAATVDVHYEIESTCDTDDSVIIVQVLRDSTVLNTPAFFQGNTAGATVTHASFIKDFAPPTGTHTYSMQVWKGTTGGTLTLHAAELSITVYMR